MYIFGKEGDVCEDLADIQRAASKRMTTYAKQNLSLRDHYFNAEVAPTPEPLPLWNFQTDKKKTS